MLNVTTLDFKDLTEQEQAEASNNGAGKEYAGYLRVCHDGKTILLESDAMEPEDVRFSRDLRWIADVIRTAYGLGLQDGASK